MTKKIGNKNPIVKFDSDSLVLNFMFFFNIDFLILNLLY
jgi:hypothetical protein